jgi:hypothetical protein
VLNIDESRVRIRYLSREYIIIPIEIKEIYTTSLENRKLVIIIETIYIDRREPTPSIYNYS